MELKICKCMHCGNIIEVIEDHGVPVICCGEPMKLFKAGETDGAAEKHVPAVTVEGGVIRVQVGEVAHPMTEEHHIAFIWLVTDKGIHRAVLNHTGAPEAVFQLAEGEKAEAVYATCTACGKRRCKPSDNRTGQPGSPAGRPGCFQIYTCYTHRDGTLLSVVFWHLTGQTLK